MAPIVDQEEWRYITMVFGELFVMISGEAIIILVMPRLCVECWDTGKYLISFKDVVHLRWIHFNSKLAYP